MDADMLQAVRQLGKLSPLALEEQIAGLRTRLRAYEALLTIVRHLREGNVLEDLQTALLATSDLAALGDDLPTTADLGRQELTASRSIRPTLPTPPTPPAKPTPPPPTHPSVQPARPQLVGASNGHNRSAFARLSDRVRDLPDADKDDSKPAVEEPSLAEKLRLTKPPEPTYKPAYKPSVDPWDPPERPATLEVPAPTLAPITEAELWQAEAGNVDLPAADVLERISIPKRENGGRGMSYENKQRFREVLWFLAHAGPSRMSVVCSQLRLERPWCERIFRQQDDYLQQQADLRWTLTDFGRECVAGRH